MFWQHRQPIKQPLSRCIRPRERETNRVLIKLGDFERLAVNYQQITLWGADIFIHVNRKREDYVVRIKGLPVRKTNTLAQMQREYTPVRRNLPRLRKPGFSLLRRTIDADQVRVAPADHFTGNRVGSGNRIQ